MRSQEANQWQRHMATGPRRKTGAKSAMIPPAMVSDKKETCVRKQMRVLETCDRSANGHRNRYVHVGVGACLCFPVDHILPVF